MKQLHITFILFTFSLFSHTVSQAQEVWDWKMCIDYALKNNLQLKQAEINVQLEQANLKQQKLNYSPSINGNTNYDLKIGNNYDFFSNSYSKEIINYQDYGIGVNQPIFDGLITPNSIKKSKIDLEALKLDQEVLKNNIQLQILTAFLNIMNANEQYQQAVNQKASTQEQYDRTVIMIDAGAAAEKSLLDISAQLTSEELTESQIKNQLDLAYLNLKIILQLDKNKNITVQIPELPTDFSTADLQDVLKIYNDALGIKPEIKSSQLRVKSAQKQIAIAKGNYYPTLSLSGNLFTFFTTQFRITHTTSTGNYMLSGAVVSNTFEPVLIPETITTQSKVAYKKQLNQNLSYSVGISLAIPIYNKYQVQTAVKRSNLQFKSALIAEQQAETDLYNSIQQAYIKTEAAIANYKAAQRNFETAQKSYDYAVERLNAGNINQLEVNLAKTNLANAQSKFTQSKYEYLFNEKLLDFYQGKKIEL